MAAPFLFEADTMQIDTRRLSTQTFAIGSSLAWGVMELIALARVRWAARRQR